MRRRLSCVCLSTPSPRHQTFRVLRRALLFRNIQLLYRPNPRSRTFTCNDTTFGLVTVPSKGTRYPLSVAPRLQVRALCELNAQTKAPDDPCPLHPHGTPREFVLTSCVFKGVLPRFYTKSHSHPSFHYVSHDHSYLFTCRSFKQSMGIVPFEVFVRHLRGSNC